VREFLEKRHHSMIEASMIEASTILTSHTQGDVKRLHDSFLRKKGEIEAFRCKCFSSVSPQRSNHVVSIKVLHATLVGFANPKSCDKGLACAAACKINEWQSCRANENN
jgi:hypothetical protein